ncbi:hypothetical protein A2291_07760 [candidate division WOR-1 bacterium RIFOXYB2_FULL_42_35]|uniref:Shedu protein SduA C-terminal domain-containing protein n=1 Tax=candidate division WOR-1 bacterium RIFOXYC2_FULL_41_25 TaxID=1802586 RepID=A0A1F4TJ19_UNCSA|nr:MAG: hypothetical protein A2247_08285 [candidate division WOR-1 bacterium RIFOXYA2_FULL_41_14]OGC21817.1 MAG: hypothetical protein A2291_07760 [candidate division WOR-1 bacterium RIFOXYB2_FULL_42_35]OGC32715.1 MAG: hypothetical protein A2462_04150 [candidate division WOR-1 bacterium RIFOXYC2_FULL_41_25]OGC44033.1 MAG: hypothetical protein A2548_00320 [candidate division WOR-1 bacterium RIFOXYD2_FULL_41_8]
MTKKKDTQSLKKLISAREHKEKKCAEYLTLIPEELFHKKLLGDFNHKTEYRGNSGVVDFIAVGKVMDGATRHRALYLWELKSPQSYIFEQENKTRLIPSQSLVRAENQLLNYYYELSQNDYFRKKFKNLGDCNDIHLGGIIIGSKKTLIKRKKRVKEALDENAFEEACRIRDIFYKRENIVLYTWDDILELIEGRSKENVSEQGTQKDIPLKRARSTQIIKDK